MSKVMKKPSEAPSSTTNMTKVSDRKAKIADKLTALGMDEQFIAQYMPDTFKSRRESQQFDWNWNICMNRPMSEQHAIICKLKMFCENKFDVVVIGVTYEKNKLLANMLYKCFVDPLSKNISDMVGDEYANQRGVSNFTAAGGGNNTENTGQSRAMREMLAIKEDKLRYSQIHVINVYGLGIRVHIPAGIDKSVGIAQSIATAQIDVAAKYLAFKKKHCSGWGINSFLMILHFTNNKLSPMSECLIELMTKLFGNRIFDSTVFLLEQDYQRDITKTLTQEEEESIQVAKEHLEAAKKEIAHKGNCKLEGVIVESIETLAWDTKEALDKKGKADTIQAAGLIQVNWVSSTLAMMDVVAKQTYIDPNPFEPDGMTYQEAITTVENVKKKYKMQESEWYRVINIIYTMIPN